jgi:hypothetical protein
MEPAGWFCCWCTGWLLLMLVAAAPPSWASPLLWQLLADSQLPQSLPPLSVLPSPAVLQLLAAAPSCPCCISRPTAPCTCAAKLARGSPAVAGPAGAAGAAGAAAACDAPAPAAGLLPAACWRCPPGLARCLSATLAAASSMMSMALSGRRLPGTYLQGGSTRTLQLARPRLMDHCQHLACSNPPACGPCTRGTLPCGTLPCGTLPCKGRPAAAAGRQPTGPVQGQAGRHTGAARSSPLAACHRRPQRAVAEVHAVMQLVALPQALQAGQSLGLAGLRDQHALEAARQGGVRLQVLPAGGGGDVAELRGCRWWR